MAGRITRGEVRLVSFPHPDKTRPVVVLTRDRIIGHLAYVTVAPITSTIRGTDAEVALDADDGMKAPCVVNLLNVRALHQSQIGRRVTQLSQERMKEICAALAFAVGCDNYS